MRENYKQGSLVSVQKRGRWKEKEPASPILPYNVWAREQQRLATQLGLKHVQAYLVHFCLICGQPTKKGAKVNLCENHYKEYRRTYLKLAKRKEREKKLKRNSVNNESTLS